MARKTKILGLKVNGSGGFSDTYLKLIPSKEKLETSPYKYLPDLIHTMTKQLLRLFFDTIDNSCDLLQKIKVLVFGFYYSSYKKLLHNSHPQNSNIGNLHQFSKYNFIDLFILIE